MHLHRSIVLISLSLACSAEEQPKNSPEASGGAASSPETSGGAGSVGDCDFGSDEAVATTVTIENNTKEDLFLLTSMTTHSGVLVASDGTEVPLGLRENVPMCPPTLREGGWPGQAIVEYAVRIVPGGSFVRNWDGLYSLVRTLPARCSEEGAEETCVQRLIPTQGEEIRFDAVSTVVCSSGDSDCTCDADAEGSCVIMSAGSSEPITHRASFTALSSPPVGGYLAEFSP